MFVCVANSIGFPNPSCQTCDITADIGQVTLYLSSMSLLSSFFTIVSAYAYYYAERSATNELQKVGRRWGGLCAGVVMFAYLFGVWSVIFFVQKNFYWWIIINAIINFSESLLYTSSGLKHLVCYTSALTHAPVHVIIPNMDASVHPTDLLTITKEPGTLCTLQGALSQIFDVLSVFFSFFMMYHTRLVFALPPPQSKHIILPSCIEKRFNGNIYLLATDKSPFKR